MTKEEFEDNFMVIPIDNGFGNYRLSELERMLKEVLEYNESGFSLFAVPQDKPFIKALVFEIDRRKNYDYKR